MTSPELQCAMLCLMASFFGSLLSWITPSLLFLCISVKSACCEIQNDVCQVSSILWDARQAGRQAGAVTYPSFFLPRTSKIVHTKNENVSGPPICRRLPIVTTRGRHSAEHLGFDGATQHGVYFPTFEKASFVPDKKAWYSPVNTSKKTTTFFAMIFYSQKCNKKTIVFFLH